MRKKMAYLVCIPHFVWCHFPYRIPPLWDYSDRPSYISPRQCNLQRRTSHTKVPWYTQHRFGIESSGRGTCTAFSGGGFHTLPPCSAVEAEPRQNTAKNMENSFFNNNKKTLQDANFKAIYIYDNVRVSLNAYIGADVMRKKMRKEIRTDKVWKW